MEGWRETTLKDHIHITNGYAFKSKNFSDENFSNSLPVLKIKNIASGQITIADVQYHLYENTYEKFVVKKNDILLALTGNHPEAETQVVGEASIYKFIQKALLNQRVAKIQARYGLDNYFLYSFLKNDATHDYLASQSSGSASQANIAKNDIENTPIFLPPLPEQKAIAGVLSALDDKIDLLHRQNKTLEALAETLFRQWFIEEAEDDWEEAHVYDFARHVKVTVKPNSNTEVLYAHYSLPAFDNNKRPTMELGGNIKSNKYGVPNNSVLISKLNPITPRIWPIADNANGKAICSTEFQVARPVKENYFCFVYYLLKSQPLKNILQAAASGTSGSHQRVKPSDIFDFSFLRPPEYKIINYSKIITPQLDKIFYNQKQIQTLENLRDTLLPKLMSGAVRVRFEDAERGGERVSATGT